MSDSLSARAVSRALALMLLMASLLAFAAPDAQAKPAPNRISLVPTITNVSVQNGQLVARGVATAVINGQTTRVPFTAPVTMSATPNLADPTACPILDLQLGPIHLNLLGLKVDTSPICLTITAFQGGGLLGDLLCGVAHLLDQGTPLSTILGGLPQAQLKSLLGGLTNLLNGALPNLNNATLQSVQQVNLDPTCSILHLALGPLDLTLLGLNVHLDNCANPGGPVTVDITGVTGPGNVLGNLLCGLLGALSPGLTLQQILQLILALLGV